MWKKPKRCQALLVTLSGLIIIGGCGPYRLGTTLPANLKTVYVPTFQNSSAEPGIEVDITNAVTSRFRMDGNLRPVSEEEADSILEGEIIGWERMVIGYRDENVDEIEEYRLYVKAVITFRNRLTSEVLFSQEPVRGYTDFFIDASLPESERAARPEAFQDLAREIVDRVISVW